MTKHTRRSPAPKPAEVGVRFAITRPTMWNGNGFGTSGAEWVALVGNVEVGRYEYPWSEVFGERTYGVYTVTAWKQAIARKAAEYSVSDITEI